MPLNQYIPKNDSIEVNPYLKLLPELNLRKFPKPDQVEDEPRLKLRNESKLKEMYGDDIPEYIYKFYKKYEDP